MPHVSYFKHDLPSRVDVAAKKKADAEKQWREVCAIVDARDGKSCRCCDKRSDPEATGLLKRGHRHHLIYRSAGGPDTSDNLCTLCSQCHSDEHHNKLRIEGNPDVALTFFRKDEAGEWFTVREEIAVRVVRKD
jgi:5-methylcytosine-specific restriction endonuclease McrA